MRQSNTLNKLVLTFILFLTVTGIFAQQNFKYQANLQKIDTSGFYRINLQPSIVANCRPDFADIRVSDQSGKFIPYIFGNQLPCNNQYFIVFPRLNHSSITDSVTSLIAENKSILTISQLWLSMRNTSVQRMVNLSGSDDLKKWYAIKEDIELADAGSSSNGVYQQLINFPASSYRYFKIQINHKNKEAVSIINMGTYLQQLLKPSFSRLPDIRFTQKDSAKLSSIIITFNAKYQINKLHIDLGGSKFYKRNVAIYQVDKKARNLIIDTILTSAGSSDLYFSTRANIIELQIINDDNPPLVVKAVAGYQINQSLISYLEKGHQYHILLGDEKIPAPVYDLRFFTDSLGQQLRQINPGNVANNPLYKKTETEKSAHIPIWLIWIIIITVISILALLTFKMMQEVNKRPEEDRVNY